MRPKVVIAEPISDAGIKALEEACDVDLAIDVPRSDLIGRLGNAEGLVVRSATEVDADLIGAAPSLRVIGRAGIGVDNIDVDAATTAGVMVVNAPQANTISAAEHTMALLLAQARRVAEADASVRAGHWERKALKGVELHGKTLGLIGLGRIGSLVAERAAAFGMRVIASDPYIGPERARRLGVELANLDQLYREADFISIHVPRTPETERLIDARAFDKMKPGVRIVNTSRGGVVDEKALAEAIQSGRVAGAALDVFSEEPPADSALFSLPSVVMTPHLGASTGEAQDRAGTTVAEAVAAALRGELVPSAVNLDLGPEVADEVRPFLPIAEQLGQIFVVLAEGLPSRLVIRAEGHIGEGPIRPLALAALKGALSGVSAVGVSYVNAAKLAEQRGITVDTEASPAPEAYVSLVRLSGDVGGRPVSVAATILARKGPVLIEIFDYEIELPLTRYLLIVANEDVPGVIGRLGTYLGEMGINIANMVVGRAADGAAAMMGLNLDQPLGDEQVEGLRNLDGIAGARFIDLGERA